MFSLLVSTKLLIRKFKRGKVWFSGLLLLLASLCVVIFLSNIATRVEAGGGAAGAGGGAAGAGAGGGGASSSTSTSTSSSSTGTAAAGTGGSAGSGGSGSGGGGGEGSSYDPGSSSGGLISTGQTSSSSSGSGSGGSSSGSKNSSGSGGSPTPPPDKAPPAFLGSDPDPVVFSADSQKKVVFYLLFSDKSPPLSYKKLAVGGVNYKSTSFTHDFSRAGTYDLTYNVCDKVGNCTGDVTLPGFFTVVANTPEWAAIQCQSTDCPSKFQITTETKLADGEAAHVVRVSLVDRYGNPAISVPGIKQVDATFNFRDTNKLDQIKKTGEAAVFESSELTSLEKNESASLVKMTDQDGDGIFTATVKSYTPTSAGYLPIKDLGFDLNFESVDYNIQALGNFAGVGETKVNASIAGDPTTHFAFYPAMLSIPAALIWNGEYFIADFRGIENITVNSIKRFGVYLQNNSKNVTTDAPQLGIAMDSGSSSVSWGEASVEQVDNTVGLDVSMDLDADGDENFDGVVTNLSDWLSSIAQESLKVMRFRAKSILAPGASIEDEVLANMQTYVCYSISGKSVCHRGEKLEKEGGEEGVIASLYNPGIEILGSIRSASGTTSKQTGSAINQSLGDVVQNEFQDAINRNLASLLSNSSKACITDRAITSAAALENFNCKFNNGSVTYFRDADVELNLTDETLPTGTNTLVIEGGDLWIKSNLKYAGNSSFGIIVLKSANGAGGNIYVYPQVTNLVGAVYAEGGVISVNALGKSGEDASSTCDGSNGFCDRSYELRNQLYWKGLLATANTIGGSDKTSYECPTGVTCDSRETARIYDLSYLRTYHPNSGGLTAAGTDSTASFVVEYDSRIQSSTPPLFEVGTGISGSELGADVLQVTNPKKWWWPF